MMNQSSQLKELLATYTIVVVAVVGTWVMNLVTFVQTVLADGFVWSEIGVFTIIQAAGIVVWPIAFFTGPISLFL